MGSVSYNRPKGETNREHFARELPDTVILADSTVGGVWYAAAHKRDNPDEVYALVFKTQWTRGYFNFTVKHMDETVGPCETDAPAKVLDLLTPTTYEWANEWRQKCRDTIAAKAAAKEKAKSVVSGTVIEVEHPLSFGQGRTFSRFEYTGEKATFWALSNSVGARTLRVNLGSDWKHRPYVITEQAVAV